MRGIVASRVKVLDIGADVLLIGDPVPFLIFKGFVLFLLLLLRVAVCNKLVLVSLSISKLILDLISKIHIQA